MRSWGGGMAARVCLAEVQLPMDKASAAELSVMLPDGVIARGSDAQALAALVRALRS